ncbi:hypothetical protein GUJ93_ZPchr0011g27791 [Zizania palustris]|uniref:Uncharacterized protein n=1 Tax=Zizania palustris TaxID=103762 RepID=A0A8J6BSA0_ZIZPA|nr:hypothetical protein GUJ93_ZPchr0011g27791 [Zizania palustris]
MTGGPFFDGPHLSSSRAVVSRSRTQGTREPRGRLGASPQFTSRTHGLSASPPVRLLLRQATATLDSDKPTATRPLRVSPRRSGAVRTLRTSEAPTASPPSRRGADRRVADADRRSVVRVTESRVTVKVKAAACQPATGVVSSGRPASAPELLHGSTLRAGFRHSALRRARCDCKLPRLPTPAKELLRVTGTDRGAHALASPACPWSPTARRSPPAPWSEVHRGSLELEHSGFKGLGVGYCLPEFIHLRDLSLKREDFSFEPVRLLGSGPQHLHLGGLGPKGVDLHLELVRLSSPCSKPLQFSNSGLEGVVLRYLGLERLDSGGPGTKIFDLGRLLADQPLGSVRSTGEFRSAALTTAAFGDQEQQRALRQCDYLHTKRRVREGG